MLDDEHCRKKNVIFGSQQIHAAVADTTFSDFPTARYNSLFKTFINLQTVIPGRLSLFLLIFVSTKCFTQESINTDVTNVTKVTFLNPGVTCEKRIGKLQTLYAQAFLSTAIYLGYSSSLGNTSSIDFYPALALQYRYYYNAGKRNAKGRRVEMNSLNYLAGVVETDFYREIVSYDGQTELRAAKIFGIAWGFQRNYPKRFSLDLNLGLAYINSKETTVNDGGEFITRNVGEITNLGQIGLGFWLNKRK